jgi:hypothetical protein
MIVQAYKPSFLLNRPVSTFAIGYGVEAVVSWWNSLLVVRAVVEYRNLLLVVR